MYTNGTGGANNTFRNAQNLYTNDANLYMEKGYNQTYKRRNLSTSRDAVDAKNFYYQFRRHNGELGGVNMKDTKAVFECGMDINQDGKVHYSKCLDLKGNSAVEITDKQPAGMPNKIQTKAYRANTQSKQIDGLYKPEKFA